MRGCSLAGPGSGGPNTLNQWRCQRSSQAPGHDLSAPPAAAWARGAADRLSCLREVPTRDTWAFAAAAAWAGVAPRQGGRAG